MFKSVVSGLIAASVMLTPVAAEARGRDNGRSEHSDRGHRGGGCGWLCGAIIGGVVIGALANSDKDSRYDERDYRYDRPEYRSREYRRTCYEYREPVYDYYGRFLYNNVYTRCN